MRDNSLLEHCLLAEQVWTYALLLVGVGQRADAGSDLDDGLRDRGEDRRRRGRL